MPSRSDIPRPYPQLRNLCPIADRNRIRDYGLTREDKRADVPDGLYILDQHAAHARVIFDRVFRLRTGQPADSQKLMLPERVTLDEFQHETLVRHLKLIEQQGFSLQRLGDLTWQINAVPLSLTAPHCPEPEHALQRLLDEFAAEQIVSSPQQAVAATIACHSATRAGDALSVDEMQAIIDQLAETPEPHRCPMGGQPSCRSRRSDWSRSSAAVERTPLAATDDGAVGIVAEATLLVVQANQPS